MASSAELIEQQKARLLLIAEAELSKIKRLSDEPALVDRDARAMLETIARLLKQLEATSETNERAPDYLSPTAIEKALGPTSP